MNRHSSAFVAHALLAIATLSLAGCGGGGAAGGGGAPDDGHAPTANILFPPANALTTGSTVTVTGTANDANGVLGVAVNGVTATSSDGFAHWSATLPVNAGANVLVVSSSDQFGNAVANADSVTVTRSSVWPQRSTSVGYDPIGGRMLLIDNSLDGILEWSSADAFSILSSPSHGSGPSEGFPNDVASIGTNAFVAANLVSLIYKVDLTTGNRTLLSGGAAGSGTAFVATAGIDVDATRNRLLALDFHHPGLPQSNRLVVVDATTGARTVLSSDTVGSGATLGFVSDIVHDTVNDRYITAGSGSLNQVLAIDPVTGARTELSGGTVGSGASLSGASDIVLLSPTVALVLVTPSTSNARNLDNLFVSVDLTTGVRTLVTHTGVVSQPTFASGSMSIARDPVSGAIHLSESSGGTVWRITLNSATDIASIAQVEPATASIGSGPKLVQSSGLAYDPAGQRFFVTERRPVQITGIALASGARAEVSSATVGTGTAFFSPRRVEWDAAGSRAVVVDGVDVYGVAPSTGDRTLIGSDPTLLGNSQIIVASAIDPSRNRIVLGGSGDSAVNAMNLATGVVTNVTTLSTVNPASSQVKGLAYDSFGDRYFAIDEDSRIFRITASNGATTQIATGNLSGLDQPGAVIVLSSQVAYVLDQLDGDLFLLNPGTGSLQRYYQSGSLGTNGSGNDGALAWDPARGLLYWTDNGIHGISVMNPATADRVIISR